MKQLLIKSPAKINLFLYITGKLNNGYHELFTLMACVDLYDEMELTFNQSQTTVTSDNPDVPQDQSNLAFKAVNLFTLTCLSQNKSCLSENFPNGVKIHIKKNIPVGAGLGGGSSNAATVLKAMNSFYDVPFSLSQLMEMGLELGADVPFFIQGKVALAEGIGEKITPIPFFEQFFLDKKYILIFYPGVEASTPYVYKNLDLGLTKPVRWNMKSLLKIADTDNGLINIKNLNELIHNDLEISTRSLYPEIELFRKEVSDYLSKTNFLSQCDCLQNKLIMTGSGSTFFSLFSDYEKAKSCFNEFSTKWKFSRKKIFLTSFV